MRQNISKPRPLSYSDHFRPQKDNETECSHTENHTTLSGYSTIPSPEEGGILIKRNAIGYTIEIQTDCHGDYNRCTIRLIKLMVDDLLPIFRRFGQVADYLPGIKKMEKPNFYRILFSKPENAIFITLRKNTKSQVINELEEIVASACRQQ